MRKVAVKTSAMTFLALVLVLVITLSFYMLAFTASAADFFSDSFGWYGLGSRLSYAAYSKDDDRDINMLATAAERAILHYKKTESAPASEMVYQYTYELIAHKDFHSEGSKTGFADWMDANKPTGGAYQTKYEHFIKGYCYAAMYKSKKTTPNFPQGNKRAAVDFAVFLMEQEGGFAFNNPVHMVAVACGEDSAPPKEAVDALLAYFEDAFAGIDGGTAEGKSQLINLCIDAKMVADAHKTEAVSVWQARIDALI